MSCPISLDFPYSTSYLSLISHASCRTYCCCFLQQSGESALSLTAWKGHTETAKALLAAHGINVNHENVSINFLTPLPMILTFLIFTSPRRVSLFLYVPLSSSLCSLPPRLTSVSHQPYILSYVMLFPPTGKARKCVDSGSMVGSHGDS